MKPVIPSGFQAGHFENWTGRAGSLGVVQVDGIDMINVLFVVDFQLVISQGQTAVESLGAPDDQPVRVPRVGGFKVFVTCFTRTNTFRDGAKLSLFPDGRKTRGLGRPNYFSARAFSQQSTLDGVD